MTIRATNPPKHLALSTIVNKIIVLSGDYTKKWQPVSCSVAAKLL